MESKKNFIMALALFLSFSVIANTDIDLLPSKAKTSNFEVLNTIFQSSYSVIAENRTPKQYSDQQRQFNISALAETLVHFYELDEQHDFRPFNSGSQYSHYYILQHYYNHKPVHNEVVTIALNENNSIIKFSGVIKALAKQSNPKARIKTKSHADTSSRSILSWLTNNAQSPLFKHTEIINSIVDITYINKSGQYISAFKIDVFHIDENGNPNRELLIIDPISKVIYEKTGLLKLNTDIQISDYSSVTKNLHSKGGNFYKGERDYKAPFAPKVTDCQFLTFIEEFYLNKRLLVTVNMNNLLTQDQWDAYTLTQEDCENESIFYEEDTLGLIYAYSPLADAHFHAELVMEMYNVFLQEPILGVCTVNNTHPNCTQYYQSNGVNNDIPIYQGVHYGPNYVGAFWSGGVAYYGDGGFGILPNVSLDTVAHELTHGYQEISSDDVYFRALDEATSDIAGEAVKEFVFNKTQGTDHEYFPDNSYIVDYRYLFGKEIAREDDVAIRELLSPVIKVMPKDAIGIGQHDLSGPISLAFVTLVSEGKFKNFKDAFKVLATSKKTCVNTSITGYAGLNLAANCIVDLADGMEHSNEIDTVNIKNELSTAFTEIKFSIE